MSWLSRFSLAQRALIGLISIVALVFGAIPDLRRNLGLQAGRFWFSMSSFTTPRGAPPQDPASSWIRTGRA
ncbi:hypothetical protein NLX86_04545 [Streptomyces sp. A3M-1-3]|uniref:hypothetical protein n=1 Tax=Streptomyces sp. A3M-1-3 TaxID=2962044 RepID=UPI0020B86478|nr:hypothetical protein [Streptomyces sp. A3M-1-3]MCP3817432.1 hypothetical protein [Streptomyces sp. A3M-1-3]